MARTYTFSIEAEQRKALAQAVGEYFGEKAKYTMPGFRYVIAGKAEILKDSTVELADDLSDSDCESLRTFLSEHGFEADQPETEEAKAEDQADEQPEEADSIKADIAVPMAGHTGTSLRNLINLLYQRQGLLNKATGGNFRVDESLTEDLLEDGKSDTPEEFLQTITEAADKLNGVEFTADRITFTGFPETDDPATILAFTQLTALMNRQALTQHHIVAKTVNDSNEKYAFRIWLLRIGMKGTEYKETRRILLSHLSGNCAFRTDEQLREFSAKQKQIREEAKAAQNVEPEETAEEAEQEGAGDEISE